MGAPAPGGRVVDGAGRECDRLQMLVTTGARCESPKTCWSFNRLQRNDAVFGHRVVEKGEESYEFTAQQKARERRHERI